MANKGIHLQGESSQGKRPSLRERGDKEPRRIFLLSPANASGVRGKMLFNHDSEFDLALRIRQSGAPLGEVYSFISGLYFRGKLTYAETFLNPPTGVAGVHIITPAAGLVLPNTVVTLTDLQRISAAAVDSSNRLYREPLHRDACVLRSLLKPCTDVVLLGSIASSKYAEPLLEIFGEQLVFPEEFVGRGDMSRGGLLLRSCSAGEELRYAALARTVRHGKRPGRLSPASINLTGSPP
jgi:hypothetical protein